MSMHILYLKLLFVFVQGATAGHHPCLNCGRSFSRKDSLRRHWLDVHMGVKNHECPVCHKKFAQRVVMRIHQAQVHGTQ